MAVALNDQSAPELLRLQPLWHRSAPASVSDRSTSGGPYGNWEAWQKHLARRGQPSVPRPLRGEQPAILWGWPVAWQRSDVQATLESPTGIHAFALRFLFGEAELDDPTTNADLSLALQLVSLAYSLPELAGQLPPETWWGVVERLHELAQEAAHQQPDLQADPRGVVRHQLLAGELPLVLGQLFPEVRALRALRKNGKAALSEALLELTDGQGLLHANLLPVMGPLFACWTRVRLVGAQQHRGPWSREAELQYQWLVRNAVRLADADGRFLLTPRSASQTWSKQLFATALELVGDDGDAAAAAAALPRGVVPKSFKLNADNLPEPSLNSDWSGIAVLAGGWSKTDVRLAVAYAENLSNFELAANGAQLLAGELKFQTTCDGEPVEIDGEWERVCWETGKRFDFLELGIDLSHGLRLERQIVFGRNDSVLYVADVVSASDDKPQPLKHSLHLPLDGDAAWHAEPETRDGVIVNGKARAAVLPLALREWRSDPRGGSLVEESGRLTLTQECHGRALCCPLFLDLDRKRNKKERTWRQLTVGESLEIVPPDLAVAFRAQSGSDQWLFYRSLGPLGNRTFLGQNTSGEFTAGPLTPSGKYKEWIEIEAM